MAPPKMLSLSRRPFRVTSTFSELPDAVLPGTPRTTMRARPTPSVSTSSPDTVCRTSRTVRAPVRRMSSSETTVTRPGSSSAVRAPSSSAGHLQERREVDVVDVLEGGQLLDEARAFVLLLGLGRRRLFGRRCGRRRHPARDGETVRGARSAGRTGTGSEWAAEAGGSESARSRTASRGRARRRGRRRSRPVGSEPATETGTAPLPPPASPFPPRARAPPASGRARETVKGRERAA